MEPDSILETNENDVVSGRGSGGNRHPGNTYFRELIKSNKAYYLSLGKNQKMDVARAIYDKILSLDPPGRFLNKNPETDNWYVVKKDRALEKISQALRERPAALKKGRVQSFADKKALEMMDSAAMALGRGVPNVAGTPNADVGTEEMYSNVSQQRTIPFDQMQGPNQISMAQKMQYQRQLNMMDMVHGGAYPGSIPQRSMLPVMPGAPFGAYAFHGYPAHYPYSDDLGYMDRLSYPDFQNPILAQPTRPDERDLSKHENTTDSSNGLLAPMPDHHRRYISAPSSALVENPYSTALKRPHIPGEISERNAPVSKGLVLLDRDRGKVNPLVPNYTERKISPSTNP
jgi:hypothetical protein